LRWCARTGRSTLNDRGKARVHSEIAITITRIRREGVTVLLLEQNAYLALNLAHRGYVLETGRITMARVGDELLNDPHVQEAYPGTTSTRT
jgi:ABC-type branched-subunit amino acid transport system ATPase component